MKIAIHNSGENGIRNAKSGISVLTFGAANSETPLWKYGALKSMTSARDLLSGIICLIQWQIEGSEE